MATFASPTLTITTAPTAGQSIVTVSYEIQFDTFDRATDQPYLEMISLIGDDTDVPGDPASAAPDDQLGTIVTGNVVRASMSAGKPTLARNVVSTVATATLNEDRLPVPNPDEIRAVVALTPRGPVAVAHESNVVTLTITDPQEIKTTVPDVIEDSRAFANKAIVTADLVPRFNGPNSANAWVMSQSPVGGTSVARQSVVTVQLSDKIPP
jgi:hypothetical protein